MKKILSISTIACLLLIVINVGCSKPPPQPPTGGTGSGGGSNNRPPVANAGPDQTITLPVNSVNLDGSGSTDPDNNIVSYQWTKIEGPVSFTISNANAVQTPISNLAEGTYQFELKVTDNTGLFSKDTVQVIVQPQFNPSNGDVYIAGWGTNTNGKKVARIWRNNVLQDLSDGQQDAEALSVFVSGSDVYVAGWEYASGFRLAKLWKNGMAQNLLTNGQNDFVANSVYVANNDVYVAGSDEGAIFNFTSHAILWKNGVAQNLSNGQSNTIANSVFVSGNNVYVAGYDGDTAMLWKNGVVQNFSGDAHLYSEAKSVFVSGSDVYVAGTRYPCAVGGCSDAILWKNGQPQILQLTSGGAESVYVSSNDVYVAGYNEPNAKLWKNGVGQILGNGYPSSVFVSGNDVYVVGGKPVGTTYVGILWKNSVGYEIPGLTHANSVFVK